MKLLNYQANSHSCCPKLECAAPSQTVRDGVTDTVCLVVGSGQDYLNFVVF